MSRLFSPIELRELRLANRVVVSPMCEYSAVDGLITEPAQAEAIVADGQADMVALARALLWNPRWVWHAAAELGGTVDAPVQYWRSEPRDARGVLGETSTGQR